MSSPASSSSPTAAFNQLRAAIATGDPAVIVDALPEPPTFLAALFGLAVVERNTILAGVFPVLDTDEDRQEIIEAAAMDTIARPERGSFVAVVPYIPADMLDDARNLVVQLPNPYAAEAQRALDARSLVLGMAK